MCCVYTIKSYLAPKEKAIMTFTGKWGELKYEVKDP